MCLLQVPEHKLFIIYYLREVPFNLHNNNYGPIVHRFGTIEPESFHLQTTEKCMIGYAVGADAS